MDKFHYDICYSIAFYIYIFLAFKGSLHRSLVTEVCHLFGLGIYVTLHCRDLCYDLLAYFKRMAKLIEFHRKVNRILSLGECIQIVPYSLFLIK